MKPTFSYPDFSVVKSFPDATVLHDLFPGLQIHHAYLSKSYKLKFTLFLSARNEIFISFSWSLARRSYLKESLKGKHEKPHQVTSLALESFCQQYQFLQLSVLLTLRLLVIGTLKSPESINLLRFHIDIISRLHTDPMHFDSQIQAYNP